jgi:RNA polymerase sigma-70 factor (ECF subfamily)
MAAAPVQTSSYGKEITMQAECQRIDSRRQGRAACVRMGSGAIQRSRASTHMRKNQGRIGFLTAARVDNGMADRDEEALLKAIREGQESTFERVYDAFHERVRLLAFRISHRPDWVDDLLGEAWTRAFRQRTAYDPARPFLVWMAGILRNVYREHCRSSPTTWDQDPDEKSEERSDLATPEALAEEAELLASLNDCVGRLSKEEADIVRLRFFEGQTLRSISQKLGLPEATLREIRLPAIYKTLRKSLSDRGIEIYEIFPAQDGPERQ